MKNLIFGLMGLFLFSFKGNTQEINSLNDDKDFQTYLKNEFEFNKKSNPKLVKKLSVLKEEKQLPEFYISFNTTEKEYKNHVNQQNQILLTISKKYKFSSFKEEELKKHLSNEIFEILESDNSLIQVTTGSNCLRRYKNALAINYTTALVAHAGCATLDLTVIAGIICHGAVAVGHAAANDNAYLDYLDCIK